MEKYHSRHSLHGRHSLREWYDGRHSLREWYAQRYFRGAKGDHKAKGDLALFVAWLLVLAAPSLAQAQITVDRLFPPVVARDQQTTVVAEGKLDSWPVEVSADRSSVTITAGEKKGELQIQVPADQPPGVLWLRLRDQAAASGWTPLLIASHAVAVESEPNNAPPEATPVDLPAAVAGRLAKSGDVDCFRIHAAPGTTLVASLTAQQILKSPMDAVLQIVDAQGNVLAQNDDLHGRDPQIVMQTPQASELFVRVFAFPETPNSTIGFAGGAAYTYALNLTTGPFLDHALPLRGDMQAADGGAAAFGWNLTERSPLLFAAATAVSPPTAYRDDASGWQWQDSTDLQTPAISENEDLADAPLLSLPVQYSGHLRSPDEVDRIRFAVQASQRYRVVLASQHYGFPLDAAIEVVNAEDGTAIANNDDRARTEFDPTLEFVAKQDMTVELRIKDMANQGGPYHAYAVTVHPAVPAVQLTLAADHYRVTAGETLDIPITVSREFKYVDKLQVSIEGLPEGVDCPPLTSVADGDTSKLVTLKLTANADAAFQGNIRVIAQPVDEADKPLDQPPRRAVHRLRPQVVVDQVWLTVAPKKK
ncbi:COG1470 family protein [Roseimaritima ulvae]|uniref:Serine protease n=1 Tax=Roseimaritima ulvae TaxID=980254 RepID=A0A5B9QYV8_9BACT|nr:PPC domain-containing protein [Roseimaritima ulvae]QEG43040.1 hypothetical protein UC8_50830 [Roseimaritima ulvae]